MRLLFTDTETGGTDPREDALLEVSLVVFDDGKILATNTWKIKSDGKYVYPAATKINGINLKEHDKTAMKSEDAAMEIVAFIRKWFEDDRATLAGHNVSFDRDFLKTLINEYSMVNFDSLVSHRLLDVMSVLNFMAAAHVLPESVLSSDGAFKYFDIKVAGRHTSMGDIKATLDVFNKLTKHLKL